MNQTTDVQLSSQREYYDAYWTNHQQSLNAHEVRRLAEILNAIALIMESKGGKWAEIRICDLGCGRGWLSAELSKFGSVTGVDLSPEATLRAQEQWPHLQFQAVDILAWRPQDAFDLVVSSEVIEHVPDHARFAATVRYLLREGGHLILTTPNGRVKAAWDAGNQGEQIIENWLTPNQLKKLLGTFVPLSHKVFLFDFSYVGLFRILSAPKLLRLLNALGLGSWYDLLREKLKLGLYQVFAGRLPKQS